MSKYLAIFEIPVTVCLNPGQLTDALRLINTHFTGHEQVPRDHDVTPMHHEAVYACHRSTSDVKVRIGLREDGQLEQIFD